MLRLPKTKTPETLIKLQIKNWLKGEEWMGKLTWWNNLQGIGSWLGLPDIFVLKKGKLYGLEIKSAKGKESDYQRKFGELLIKYGGIYVVVRSWQEVERLLE